MTVGKTFRAIAIASILSKPIPAKGGESMLTELRFMAVYCFYWHIWKHNCSLMQQTVYTLAKPWTDSSMRCFILCAFHPLLWQLWHWCIQFSGNSGARGFVRTKYKWQCVLKGSAEFKLEGQHWSQGARLLTWPRVKQQVNYQVNNFLHFPQESEPRWGGGAILIFNLALAF